MFRSSRDKPSLDLNSFRARYSDRPDAPEHRSASNPCLVVSCYGDPRRLDQFYCQSAFYNQGFENSELMDIVDIVCAGFLGVFATRPFKGFLILGVVAFFVLMQ